MNIKPNALHKFVHRFLMLRPISAFLARVLHRADELLLRLTHDRCTFAQFAGLPIIQLTTKGARTGRLRTMPLVGLPDGEKIALIASNFGREHNPGWYYNLKAHLECEVIFNGGLGKYIAREVDGDEYNRYWKLAVSYYAGYEKYKQRAAHRHIPVMVLESKE